MKYPKFCKHCGVPLSRDKKNYLLITQKITQRDISLLHLNKEEIKKPELILGYKCYNCNEFVWDTPLIEHLLKEYDTRTRLKILSTSKQRRT